MVLSIKEQRVILQGLWQVLAANPTPADNDFIQNILVRDWDCHKGVTELEINSVKIIFGFEFEVKPWICVAIEEDPYESFEVISRMGTAKKEFIKELVIKLIENGDNYQQKAPYAHVFFNNCQIPFRIAQRIYPGNVIRNVII